jgi:hypothetical protein
MSEQSKSLFDDVIRGIFDTAYRFAGLTVGILAIPFMSKTKRFLRAVIAAEAHLSSLSVLTIWTFATYSLPTGTFVSVPNAFLAKETNYPIIYVLITTFIFVLIVDLVLRLCCSSIRNSVRRRLYISLLRLSLGAIAFGAFVTVLMDISLGHIPGFEIFFGKAVWSEPTSFQAVMVGGLPVFYLIPMFLFALPLTVVARKLMKSRRLIQRVPAMIAIVVLVPVVLLNLGVYLYLQSAAVIANVLPEPRTGIAQRQTSCLIQDGRIIASSYLMLLNSKSDVLAGSFLSVSVPTYDSHGSRNLKYIGKGSYDQKFILSDSQFVPVQLSVETAADAVIPSKSPFECTLGLLTTIANPEPLRRN